MNPQRKLVNQESEKILFRLTYDEIELDGSGGLRTKYNELSKTCERIEKENDDLLHHRDRLEREITQLKISLQNANKEIAKLLQVKVDESEKYKANIEKEQSKMNKMKIHLEILKNDKDELQEDLKAEKKKFENMIASNCQLKEEISKLKDHLKRSEDIESHYNLLSERIAHFHEETQEKGTTIPQLGQNNAEDFEIQKFMDFLITNVKKLNDLVPNGLSLSPSQNHFKLIDGKCQICHLQTKFVQCFTETCGGMFHVDCIQRWFKTKKECPSCHEDSIPLENNDNGN